MSESVGRLDRVFVFPGQQGGAGDVDAILQSSGRVFVDLGLLLRGELAVEYLNGIAGGDAHRKHAGGTLESDPRFILTERWIKDQGLNDSGFTVIRESDRGVVGAWCLPTVPERELSGGLAAEVLIEAVHDSSPSLGAGCGDPQPSEGDPDPDFEDDVREEVERIIRSRRLRAEVKRRLAALNEGALS